MSEVGGRLHRLDLGYFVRPAAEVGGPDPRVEPVPGYVVRRDEGTILFDTGICPNLGYGLRGVQRLLGEITAE